MARALELCASTAAAPVSVRAARGEGRGQLLARAFWRAYVRDMLVAMA